MRFDVASGYGLAIAAAGLGLCLAAGVPARADGGGGNTNTNCPPGEVFDARTMQCVKQKAGVLPDAALTDYAYALAKAERYAEAIQVLDILKNPETPTALNYRGYATRHLGRLDEGIGYYRKSVALDPNYAQVREYLGEAYVIKGDMPSAQAELRQIERICGTGCDEYKHLADAIAGGSKS